MERLTHSRTAKGKAETQFMKCFAPCEVNLFVLLQGAIEACEDREGREVWMR